MMSDITGSAARAGKNRLTKIFRIDKIENRASIEETKYKEVRKTLTLRNSNEWKVTYSGRYRDQNI